MSLNRRNTCAILGLPVSSLIVLTSTLTVVSLTATPGLAATGAAGAAVPAREATVPSPESTPGRPAQVHRAVTGTLGRGIQVSDARLSFHPTRLHARVQWERSLQSSKGEHRYQLSLTSFRGGERVASRMLLFRTWPKQKAGVIRVDERLRFVSRAIRTADNVVLTVTQQARNKAARSRDPLLFDRNLATVTYLKGRAAADLRTCASTLLGPGSRARRCDLTGAQLPDADLTHVDLRGAALPQATLMHAQLEGADLRKARLRDARLQSTNLSSAVLDGADLNRAVLKGGSTLRDTSLREADLRSALLSKADFTGADLTGAALGGAEGEGTDMRSADLSGADLGHSFLDDLNLANANLEGTDLADAEWDGVRSGGIVGTPINAEPRWRLYHGFLIGRDAYLEGAPLSGAPLAGVDLSGVQLSGAALDGAILSGADLSYASLGRANLTDALLIGSNLSSALLDAETIFTGADLSGAIWLDGLKVCGPGSIGICL